MRTLTTVVCAALVCVLAASATPIIINNTGGAAPGFLEPNWTVNGGQVFVTDNTGFPFGPWLANDGTSSWISPQVSYTGSQTDAPGAYNYATTFDLTGLVPGTASLSIMYGVDNLLSDVLLNGNSTGITGSGFASLIGPVTINSGFIAGTNTLTFQTVNAAGDVGNPSGFRAAITGSANPVPEPATILLTAFGLAGLAFRRRRTS